MSTANAASRHADGGAAWRTFGPHMLTAMVTGAVFYFTLVRSGELNDQRQDINIAALTEAMRDLKATVTVLAESQANSTRGIDALGGRINELVTRIDLTLPLPAAPR